MLTLVSVLTLINFSNVVIAEEANVEEPTEEVTYTTADEDLMKDENFVKDYESGKYPSRVSQLESALVDQIEVEVLALGFTEDRRQIFLYCYIGLAGGLDLKLSSVNMYIGEDSKAVESVKNYKLAAIDNEGIFHKYLIQDFTLPLKDLIYLNVVSVYRYYGNLKSIDGSYYYPESDNVTIVNNGAKVSEVVYKVAKRYCIGNIINGMVCTCEDLNVLEIDVTYTGCIEFKKGINWGSLDLGYYDQGGHSWFICFDAENYIIDYIYNADLTYYSRQYKTTLGFIKTYPYGENYNCTNVTIRDVDKVSFETYNGRLTYSWNRIMSGSDFIDNAEDQDISIDKDVNEKIKNSQWVFAFAETEIQGRGLNLIQGAYEVKDVNILRVEFLSEGEVYNLGIVSNVVAPKEDEPLNPSGTGGEKDVVDEIKTLIDEIKEWWEAFKDWWKNFDFKKLLGIILGVVVLILCMPILPYIVKGIVFVVTLPVKGIKALKKASEKKKERRKK